ncbi:putative glucosamine 6-phosphate N-acetyltransferase [Wickerhamomyces ciferrii]|uniref:Glucosamine 6-phosphate N-acetyltransferase n=1 Tax=Wickerhamomyces ciferrii (strain ATCC 14091 / BCRC 22168 / CBS 111 / JCM 3599 / NBRC 0793 / NRRL Y-1031 F-60-10) TaxID=1206466 RepID=K0KLM2_WICCF|nr:putative glucosamine 6-phosphate N-acetyltransferase [Wickerhamomyces ciferrii]CCH43876.1 putative glucosamine 6-phosphate N-acetyltransferase [Wickerhamomyces ciferrii]
MSLPEGYTVRRLQESDFKRGVLDVLTALTTVGDLSELQFNNIVTKWDCLTLMNGKPIYNPVVIINDQDQVVATGMIFIEEKLIHTGGLVGHIEDIAVRNDQQGKKLGKFLIEELKTIGQKAGVYKIILDCDPKNEGFYEKCGFKNAGIEMQYRL